MPGRLRPSGQRLGWTVTQSTTTVEMSDLGENDGVISFVEITNGLSRSQFMWLALATKFSRFGLLLLLGLAEKWNCYNICLFLFFVCECLPNFGI